MGNNGTISCCEEVVDESSKDFEDIQSVGEVIYDSSSGDRVEKTVVDDNNNGKVGDTIVKQGKVLSYRASCCRREPNVTCRVESFGLMCSKFDDRRKRWVVEMGFGGLLYLAGLQLPRTLCYWLMTRVDPINEMFVDVDGNKFRLCTNQVRCILGIPKGTKLLPTRVEGDEALKKANGLEDRYNKVLSSKGHTGGVRALRKGYPITPNMLDRAEGDWQEEEEEEFKLLFLLLAVQMILCPTPCPRLPLDLIPAVTCALEARKYDWCELVFRKLTRSVLKFKGLFDKQGYVTGCGGCSIFLAIYYLDRLDRNPIQWSVIPRIKVWTNVEVRKACKDDRKSDGGDFGKLGMLDVAYGELHPRDARDKEGEEIDYVPTLTMAECSRTSRRKGLPKCPRLTF